jgi:DNA polymerase/3'-5' exonuclease PolX
MGDIREVYGIGTKKAVELRKHYNIRSIYALRKYVKKIPEIVSDAQRTGLQYHDHISKPIKKEEADRHAAFIQKHVPRSVIAGSYRRGVKEIGDIDVLVLGDIKHVINKLIEKKYLVATLAIGDDKFSGIARLPGSTSYRRIDVVKTTPGEKPFALLYFTGDFVQNIIMRQKAKKMKFSLSQYGLKNLKTGKMVASIKTERDIFEFLKMPYKAPQDRNHEGNDKSLVKKSGKKAAKKKAKKSTKKKAKKSTKKKAKKYTKKKTTKSTKKTRKPVKKAR